MTAATTIGHNRGPAIDEGVRWRRHCWTVARAELLPHLPLEVIRLRVRRARELGLDYRTYATAREAAGRDIVAFLFSSNALRVHRPDQALPPDRADRLRRIEGATRSLLAHAPLDAARLAAAFEAEAGLAFAATGPAPGYWATWRETRRAVLAALPPGLAPAAVMLVGAAPGEPDWHEAARLGSYLPADRFFASP